MKIFYSPSMMCADPLNMGKEAAELESAGADFFHVDIMDGNFVPNFALNMDLIRAIKKSHKVPVDVHLMVQHPEMYISALAQAGADYVVFHPETTHFPIRLMQAIHQAGMKAGVALCPKTPAEAITHYADILDMILVMSVEPGFAGQSFIPSTYDKISSIHQIIKARTENVILALDGSINRNTAAEAFKRGARFFVLGTSSIFQKQNSLHDNFIQFKTDLESALGGAV